MKHKERAGLFESCGRVILKAAHNVKLSPKERIALLHGRETLTGFIQEISATERGKETATKAMVRRCMALVHPRTDYDYSEVLIRDVADVCITFRRLAEKEHHRDHQKSIEAKYLCDALVDELTDG